jgi:hypothetical protein
MRRNPSSTSIATLVLAIAILLLSLAHPTHADAQRRRADIRPMFGVAGEGAGFIDQAQGLMGGVGVHAGVHLYGLELYGLSQGFVGALVGGPRDGNVEGILWNSGMIGFGVGAFHLAGGPSLDFAWGCQSVNAAPSCYHGIAMLGGDARLALVFSPIAITFDVHPTLYRDSTVTSFVLGVGFEL